MWERTYSFDKDIFKKIEDEISILNKCFKENVSPPKPNIIILKDGTASLNWDVVYSKLNHHWLGDNYQDILKKADQFTKRHYYYRKNKPSGLPKIEKEIIDFNEEQKTKGI